MENDLRALAHKIWQEHYIDSSSSAEEVVAYAMSVALGLLAGHVHPNLQEVIIRKKCQEILGQ